MPCLHFSVPSWHKVAPVRPRRKPSRHKEGKRHFHAGPRGCLYLMTITSTSALYGWYLCSSPFSVHFYSFFFSNSPSQI